ncbi:ABCAD protein, partial [Malurus elegans]|nr:ABCAD protein [Malurus elegans]
LKHMAALEQNMRNMDVEFLISRFKQVQENLENFFKNINPFSVENSELGTLRDWWDAFENISCYWNLTGIWQITQLFEQDELYDIEDVFDLFFDVISLTERVAHGNITEALTEMYAFILTQEEKMPLFTDEEFSNHVEELLMLLETLADNSDESGEISVCFTVAFCWSFTTATPHSDSTVDPCDFEHNNSTLHYDVFIDIIKALNLITPDDSFACSMEDFQTNITHNLTCFFHQIEEWNSILLKFSELHHVNSSVLQELVDFWNELSLYVVPLHVNSTHAINCSSTPKSQMALQIIETLGNISVAEMETVKSLFEQLDNIYGGLSWNRQSRTSLKSVLTDVKNMTSEVSRLLNTKAVLSFLSAIQPLMTLSDIGNQTHSMLMTISALSGNFSISDNFKNFWFPVNKNYSKIMHALFLLVTNESSSNDLLLAVKDIIDFLELFQNNSEKDYTGMLFGEDHLNKEKLNNTHAANSVLLNSILRVIADLYITEDILYTNSTELHIVDFIDSFFYNATYREISTLSQNRTLEIMQEILQVIFQSTAEHDRNK